MARRDAAPRSTSELEDILAEVRGIEIESRALVTGVLAGGYSSAFRGSGIEFHEIREYVEGDDPRAVDWNVTARTGRPFVKDFVEERDRTLFFVFDCSPSMDGGFGAWSARRLGARVCACIALAADAGEDKIGFVGFADGVTQYVPARKGVRHTLHILQQSLSARDDAGSRTDLGPALEFLARASRRRATIFVVSDFLDSCPATELSACARRHDLVAVRLSLPESAEIPPIYGRFRGPESGRLSVLNGRRAEVRDAWRDAARAWRHQCDEAFLAARMDVIDVELPKRPELDAIATPILGFYRKRALREARRP